MGSATRPGVLQPGLDKIFDEFGLIIGTCYGTSLVFPVQLWKTGRVLTHPLVVMGDKMTTP